MKNKGFTLIELLAVIVILAIIALIATPIVLGIIEDSRENSKKQSAGFVIKAVEYAYNSAYAKKQGQLPTMKDIKDEFDMSGATWGPATVGNKEIKANEIVTADDVTCTVKEEGTQISVSCGDYDAESTTMEIASE